MARLLFFGPLRDLAGPDARILEGPMRLSQAIAKLEPELVVAVRTRGVRIAVNQAVIARTEDPLLSTDDEVAFLPPFSGG